MPVGPSRRHHRDFNVGDHLVEFVELVLHVLSPARISASGWPKSRAFEPLPLPTPGFFRNRKTTSPFFWTLPSGRLLTRHRRFTLRLDSLRELFAACLPVPLFEGLAGNLAFDE